jgi:hypothetical protein
MPHFVGKALEVTLRIYTFFLCFSELQNGMQWGNTISGMLQLLCFWTLSIILFLFETCNDIGARPHVYRVFLKWFLTLADDLCILSCVGAGVQR